jgi:hypothetical protein
MTPEQVLAKLGQPHNRVGGSFSYCAAGRTATLRFSNVGRLSKIT